MKLGIAGDENVQRRERNREKDRRRQLNEDLGAVMAQPAGRRFVWSLIAERCLVFSKVPTGPEGLRLEGKRDVGIDLMADLQAKHPNAYLQMVNERLVEDAREELVRKDDHASIEETDE